MIYVVLVLGLAAYVTLVLLFLTSIDPDNTLQRYAELKRREKDPALWNAQRMSIVAEKAPELYAEIVRSHERRCTCPPIIDATTPLWCPIHNPKPDREVAEKLKTLREG